MFSPEGRCLTKDKINNEELLKKINIFLPITSGYSSSYLLLATPYLIFVHIYKIYKQKRSEKATLATSEDFNNY